MTARAAGTTIVILVAGSLIGKPGALSSAQQPRTVSNGVYTADQATRGGAAYQKSCSVCHLEDLSGDQFATPLVGETFAQRWKDSNVGELFTAVKGTMPANSPGSLADETYADILAYLLTMNKYPAGGQELGTNAQELTKITFKNP
jgi:quinoprotein glucose dehydrogenase